MNSLEELYDEITDKQIKIVDDLHKVIKRVLRLDKKHVLEDRMVDKDRMLHGFEEILVSMGIEPDCTSAWQELYSEIKE